MSLLRRTIHPEVRVLDAKTGTVEYIASDESLDSYNEVILAAGWRFDEFEKNAPFVDSHDYSSIDKVLGKVIDFRVKGRRLVETVQWAIDVPGNLLAQKGFDMTAGGYLKAVSVGFVPVQAITPYDNKGQAWAEALAAVNLRETDGVRCIYLEQQQKELSACVIGANPNAVAQIERAWQAGIVSDADIHQFARINKDFGRAFERRSHTPRTHSFGTGTAARLQAIADKLPATPTPTTTPTKSPSPMNQTDYSVDFEQISTDAQEEFKQIELLRGKATPRELRAAVRRAFAAVAQEKQAAFGNPIVRYLEANPERRYLWNGMVRALAKGKLEVQSPEYRAVIRARAAAKAVSGINMQDQFGIGLLEALPLADDLYDLVLQYGAYKYLGLRRMVGQYTKYANITGYQSAVFITPTQQGQTTIPADNSLTGNNTLMQANTIASLITVSREWIGDMTVDFSEAVIGKFVQAISARIDYGCFQGNGVDDQNNGFNIGLSIDPTIYNYKIPTRPGANSVQGIARQDLLNTINLVNPAVFQRQDVQPPRWYIHPGFLPELLQIADGQAPNYLLKTPAETLGEWTLLGFPVTWAGQAPSTNAAGAVVAFFGAPDAYLVALHEEFELTSTQFGPQQPNFQFRALARGRSGIRWPQGFVRLTLSN